MQSASFARAPCSLMMNPSWPILFPSRRSHAICCEQTINIAVCRQCNHDLQFPSIPGYAE